MRFLVFVFFSFTLSLHASAQQRPRTASTDTTSLDRPALVDPGISARRTSLIIPAPFDPDIVYRDQLFLIPQRNPGGPPPFLERPTLAAIDMMIPWRLQMERERKMRPLQSILATVQIGGVAYQHLRKNGLFK